MTLTLTHFLSSISPTVVLGLVGIVLTISLFYIDNKIQSLNELTTQHLFHVSGFTAAQNMMTELHLQKMSPSLDMMRTAYIAYFAYAEYPRKITKQDIENIKSEKDYLNAIQRPLIDPNGFKKILEAPGQAEERWQMLQLILFLTLIGSQLILIWLGVRNT